MLRIVVDTQIFWRGIVKISDLKTLNSKFLNAWLERKYRLLISEEIHTEYIKAPLLNSKLATMLNITEKSLLLVNELLKREAEYINVVSKLTICRDTKDNKFLECAIDGKANFIVSADDDLLEIKELEDIKILTVPEIMECLVSKS